MLMSPECMPSYHHRCGGGSSDDDGGCTHDTCMRPPLLVPRCMMHTSLTCAYLLSLVPRCCCTQICEEAMAKARRRGYILGVRAVLFELPGCMGCMGVMEERSLGYAWPWPRTGGAATSFV